MDSVLSETRWLLVKIIDFKKWLHTHVTESTIHHKIKAMEILFNVVLCHMFSLNVHQNLIHIDQNARLQTLYETLIQALPIQTLLYLIYGE